MPVVDFDQFGRPKPKYPLSLAAGLLGTKPASVPVDNTPEPPGSPRIRMFDKGYFSLGDQAKPFGVYAGAPQFLQNVGDAMKADATAPYNRAADTLNTLASAYSRAAPPPPSGNPALVRAIDNQQVPAPVAPVVPAVLPGPTSGNPALVRAIDNQQLAATQQPAARQPVVVPAQQPVNTIQSTQPQVAAGPNVDLAGQNARLAAALAQNNDTGDNAPGYRGPLANGSAQGTPGSGDFLLSALNFAAQSSDKAERAKVPALIAAMQARDALVRNDAGFANADVAAQAGLRNAQAGETNALLPSKIGLAQADIGLRGAQATEAGARGRNITALTPAQVGLTQAQAQEAQARAASTQGLLPAEIAQRFAQSRLAGAQAATSEQLLPTQVAAQELSIKAQKRIDEVGTQLLNEIDPAKRDARKGELLALLGKDKPEEYQVTHSAGGTDPNDPTGMRKIGDNVIVTNRRTGKSEVVPLTKSYGVPPLPAISLLKKDANARNKALFDEQYGPGAADRYLK